MVAEVAPKSFFFAPVGGWKSDVLINPHQLRGNQFLATEWITKEALDILERELIFSQNISRQWDTRHRRVNGVE
jgi:hypothetical protein